MASQLVGHYVPALACPVALYVDQTFVCVGQQQGLLWSTNQSVYFTVWGGEPDVHRYGGYPGMKAQVTIHRGCSK